MLHYIAACRPKKSSSDLNHFHQSGTSLVSEGALYQYSSGCCGTVVVRPTCNQEVAGSIPGRGTTTQQLVASCSHPLATMPTVFVTTWESLSWVPSTLVLNLSMECSMLKSVNININNDTAV